MADIICLLEYSISLMSLIAQCAFIPWVFRNTLYLRVQLSSFVVVTIFILGELFHLHWLNDKFFLGILADFLKFWGSKLKSYDLFWEICKRWNDNSWMGRCHKNLIFWVNLCKNGVKISNLGTWWTIISVTYT